MATFRIRYGGDYEFEGQSLSEVVPVMSGTRGLIIMTVGLVLLIVWLGMACWSVFRIWID
mgnify:CR=1 FL=1